MFLAHDPSEFFNALDERSIAESPALRIATSRCSSWSDADELRLASEIETPASAKTYKTCQHCGDTSKLRLRDNGQPYFCPSKPDCHRARDSWRKRTLRRNVDDLSRQVMT